MARTFARLTRAAIRSLSAGRQIIEHGIVFQRLTSGDGIYAINVMVDGQRIHRVVGRESDGTTRTQAEDYVNKVRQEAKNDRLALPKGRKTALSFREAARCYLARMEENDAHDLSMKRCRLNKHLIPFFGDTPLSRITTLDIERYKKHRLAKPAQRGRKKDGTPVYVGDTKPSTVNRELAVLSHLFNKAVEWGLIAQAVARIRRFKEDSGRISYLTVEQAAKLVEAATHDQNLHIHPFIVIGLETGMRRMEILSIRREHVDVDRRIIYIPKAKAGAREQPITANLSTFLRGYIDGLPKDQQWLFASPTSKTGHVLDIRKAFRRTVAVAGMNPDVVVRHTLRHTAITHLVQAGVDLPTIKRISGHKTLLMVERYAHANGDHIRAAMNRLEARYRNTRDSAAEEVA